MTSRKESANITVTDSLSIIDNRTNLMVETRKGEINPDAALLYPNDSSIEKSSSDTMSRQLVAAPYLRPFMLKSGYTFDDSGRDFCLKAKKFEKGSNLAMRPCKDISNHSHRFILDSSKKLRMAVDNSLCIRWNATSVFLDECSEDTNKSKFRLFGSRIRAIEKSDRSREWLLGVKPENKYEKVRLFLADGPNDNPSLYSWSLDITPDDSLSMFPSLKPSLQPSTSLHPSSAPTVCADEEGWVVGGQSEYRGMTCDQLESDSENWCEAVAAIPDHAYDGKGVKEACCVCNGSTYTTTFPSTVPSLKPTISSRPSIVSEAPSTPPTLQPTQCVDHQGWKFEFGEASLGCNAIAENPSEFCERFSTIYFLDKNTYSACCVCGGGYHITVKPSTAPSMSPTSSPSAHPTVSAHPTKTATDSPSQVPSVSLAPSISPTTEFRSRFDGEDCSVDAECMNVGVSFCLDNTDPLIDANKICKAPDISNSRFLVMKTRKILKHNQISRSRRSNEIDVSRSIMRELLDAVYRPYASINEAGRGGLLKRFSNEGSFNLIGNSWGAAKLSSPYFITKHTWLKFNFTLTSESDGHALCLDFDAIASDARKCYFLAGSAFDYTDQYNPTSSIDLQNAKIVNLALGMEATQSSTNIKGISDASKAVDGFIDPIYKEFIDVEKNSVSLTSDGQNEWWEVTFQSVKNITRIIIHKAKGYPLQHFSVNLCMDSCITNVTFSETFEKNEAIVDLSLSSEVPASKVRIQMIGEGILALSEVLVFGPDDLSENQFTFPVGNMLKEGVSFGYPVWDGIKENLGTKVIKPSKGWRLKAELKDLFYSHWYIGHVKFFSDSNLVNEIDISSGDIIHTESEDESMFGPSEAFATDAYWKATANDPMFIGVANLTEAVVVNAITYKHAHLYNWVRKFTLQRFDDEDGIWIDQFEIFPDEPQISSAPSSVPSLSSQPSRIPSSSPSLEPSLSAVPSNVPSLSPSLQPSKVPSTMPSVSMIPTLFPSAIPSFQPTVSSVPSVTSSPSFQPSISESPSSSPSNLPSNIPSDEPSHLPSLQLSPLPSNEPSFVPSLAPSAIPSSSPSVSLMPTLSQTPSSLPSLSEAPSLIPSSRPSESQMPSISSLPSTIPSTSSLPTITITPSSAPSDSTSPSSGPSLSGEPSLIPSSSSMPSSNPSKSLAPSGSPTIEIEGVLETKITSGVSLESNLIVTDVIVEFVEIPNASVTINLKKDSTNGCEIKIYNFVEDFLHVNLPPNCLGNEVFVTGGSPTRIQVFGNTEKSSSTVYGRPVINYIALIQDSKTEALSGESSFTAIDLYEEFETGAETSMFRPLLIHGEHTSSAVSYANTGAFDQDFGGEIHVSQDYLNATINGNAWKAFKLETPYAVTEKTKLRFQFEVTDEAEGHALCLEDNLDENPFAGKNVRCIMVAGRQYNNWSHVVRENIAFQRPAHHNFDLTSGSTLGLAEKAVDGNMNTYTNTGLPDNNEEETDFHVDIDPGFLVTEVKIYNRIDAFIERLKHFTIYVKNNDIEESVLFSKTFTAAPADGVIHLKEIEFNIDLVSPNGLKCGMAINNIGSESGFPHMIGEFEVYGKPIPNHVQTFDFHVGDLFPEFGSQISYLVLIQDNDERQFQGKSTFSNITIYESDESEESYARPMETLRDTNPEAPRSHINFGAFVVPELIQSDYEWNDVYSLYPERNDGWEISTDVFKDPKDDCYYADIISYGYNSMNSDETMFNNYLKSTFGSVSNDGGFDVNVGESVNLFCSAGSVGFIEEKYLNSFEDALNDIYSSDQYKRNIATRGVATQSTDSEVDGLGPERAIDKDKEKFYQLDFDPGYPSFPGDFTFTHVDPPDVGYECIFMTDPGADEKFHDNYFCWRSTKPKSAGMSWHHSGVPADVSRDKRCTHLEEPDTYGWWWNYLCVPKDSPYNLVWSSYGIPSGVDGSKCLKLEETYYSWDNNYLCNLPYQISGAVTGLKETGMDLPWWKLSFETKYRISEIIIVPSPMSNGGESPLAKRFKVTILKDGNEVFNYTGNLQGRIIIDFVHGLPAIGDSVKVELTTPSEAGIKAIGLEEVYVAGGLDMEQFISDFKFNLPEVPFNKKITCDDDIDKMNVQAFICENNDAIFYQNGNEWWFPSSLVSPGDFEEEILAFLEQTHVDNKYLKEWMADRFGGENFFELAKLYSHAYRNVYSETLSSFKGMTQHFKFQRCAPGTNDVLSSKYYCFDKGAKPEFALTYTNSVETNRKYKILSPDIREQNNFGFVAVGDIDASTNRETMFPRYISHDESELVTLTKGCYEALIELVAFDPRQPLPVVKGQGELPEDCKKSGHCVVHWCNNSTLTLSATTRRAPTKFRIWSNKRGIVDSMVDANGAETGSSVYCLQQGQSSGDCQAAHLQFTAPSETKVYSQQKRRGSVSLKKIQDESLPEEYKECFDFPFDYNFVNYQDRVSGSSDPSKFHNEDFTTPAIIDLQTQVEHIDLAHNSGGGLAIYHTYDGNNNPVYIRAQVCSDDNPSIVLPFEAAISPEQIGSVVITAAAISDSGTVAVIEKNSVLLFYLLDEVTDTWFESTQLRDFENASILHVGLSTHGHFVGILVLNSDKQKELYLYQKRLRGLEYNKKFPNSNESPIISDDYDQVSVYASESGIVSIQVRDKEESQTNIDPLTFEHHFVCSDTNSIFLEGGCQCRKGYVLRNGEKVIKKYLTDDIDDVCVQQVHADMITVKSTTGIFPIHREGTYNKMREDPNNFVMDENTGAEKVVGGFKLQMRNAQGEIDNIAIEDISKIEYESGKEDPNSKVDLVLEGLQPGTLYILTLRFYETFIEVRFVTECTCAESNDVTDKTGAPTDFRIVEQIRGRVYFEFIDNSLCENMFSFVRYSEYEEFSQTVGTAVSFATLKLGAGAECEYELIDGKEEAVDNLNLSKLTVGHTYVYCVRAQSDKGPYMPSPYDTTEGSLDLSHSEQNCAPHTIQWEASISGVITTEPNAGLLPIEDVVVEYQLLSATYEKLSCEGCSGSLVTKAGGGFFIPFNIIHPYLKGSTHLDEFPVKLNFSKTTVGKETITHKFLCNDSEFDCTETGLIVFLKHLEFNKRVHVYDATTIMLAGQVFLDNTVFPGSYGCPISDAEVRVFHLTTNGNSEVLSEVHTDGQGNYEAPVVIGAQVNKVEIVHHDHKFMPAKHNNYDYDSGVLITAGELYTGNDFVDVEKAQMFLEVAGGMCNEPLGESIATISVLGCEWPGTEVSQSEFRNRVGNLPAAILDVQIIEILNEEGRRNIPIWEAFQNPPIVRTINLLDTAVVTGVIEEEEESEFHADTGTSRDNSVNPLDPDALDDEETVRFQYDGELIMEVMIESKDAYDQECYIDNANDADSFHVIDYMTVFKVRIDLVHEILKDKIYCDMVDEDYKVVVENGVGMDQMSGFEDFYTSLDYRTRAALKMCSNIAPPVPDGASASGPCVYPVTHDEDGRRAGVDTSFATGRPNPFGSYTRNMFFSVSSPDLAKEVSHKAVFFIEGLYKKGPGNSFVLPTYEPIMVLRDPPGGMSYASYENVVTTTKVVTSALAVNGDADLSLTISAGASFDGDLCTGGGIGAIVLFCQGVNDVEFAGEIPLEAEINTDFLNEENEASNSYSTTWSYTTSDEPARAGAESDVFVVPNLSVMYEEVFIVTWDKDKCQPKLDPETDLFANTLIFDVDSDGNKPALSFYSRYHLDLVTIPDLEEQIRNQQNTLATMNDGEIICCPSRPGSCLGELDKGRSGRICVDTDFNTEEQKLKTLQTALSGWKKAISDEENAKKEAIRKKSPISDWFIHSNVGSITDDEGTINDLAIAEGEHSAGLVPDELISNAKRLGAAKELLGNKEGGDDISKTMRIQFAGDAGMFEMSLTKEASSAFTKQNCNWLSPASLGVTAGLVGAGLAFGPALPIAAGALVIAPAISGCNFDLALSAGIGGIEGDLEFPGVKIGLEAGFNVQIDIQHSSTITNEKGSESGITFGLGDPDDGDEIVVDIYHDPVYGSFVFDTVGGRTKCRWEPGTAKGEDPKITVLTKPSQFIFPNEEMIFDVELANFGDHVYSYFLVGQDVDTETSALQMILDNGNTLDYEGTSVKLNKEEPIPRKIRVVKGADGYDFKPVKLALRSACEFAMDYETLPIVEELFNFVEADGTKKLKWLEPCPAVQFAGELKRDLSFLVNSQSSDKDILSVTVFNPEAGKGVTFKDMKNGRLEKIQLLYREVGDVNWRNAKRINNNGNIVDIDFTKSREDEYGYVSMDWYIGGGTLPDGRYQIAVESQCTDVGGPDEFSFFRTDSIAGNIDLSPPEQFGYALPLNGRVFFGQEMKIVFTEPIDCAIPLSFDIEMTVFAKGNWPQISLKKEDLLIICENRVLRFQVDYTRISPRILNGRRFRVEVGRIGGESLAYIADLNGNPIDHQTKGNIEFTKQFVDANLRRSLTEFHITKQDSAISCQDNHSSEKIKTEIKDLMENIDSDRLQISDVHCNESESFMTAKVQILPAPEGRRLRKGSALDNDEEAPSDLMTKLSNSLSVHNDDSARRLQKSDHNKVKVTYTMSQVNIIASEQDIAKYPETEEEKKEEQRILDTAMGIQYENTMGHTMVEMKQELALEHEEIENLKSLQNELVKERKEMQNERNQLLHEKQEEMDQFLKKKNAEFEEMENRLRKEKGEELENEHIENLKLLQNKLVIERKEMEKELFHLLEKQETMDENIEQLVRKLDGFNSDLDLKQAMTLQGLFLFIGCSIAAVVVFLQRRNNK